MQNGIWWGNPLFLLKRIDSETSVLGEVSNSAARATVLPVLGAILVNAIIVSPFVAMLLVMLCVTTTPSDTPKRRSDTERHRRHILLAYFAMAGSVAGYRVVGGSGKPMEDGICGFVLVQP